MFGRISDSLIGMMTAAALLPTAIWFALRTRPRLARQEQEEAALPLPLYASVAGEFEFERAIEAYEELIDTVLTEKRA
jgi:hypothetical protein